MKDGSVQSIVVDIYLGADQYRTYYQGVAKFVMARSSDGRNVQFPAELLRPFLTHSGIEGTFVLRYDGRGKFIDITKLTGGG